MHAAAAGAGSLCCLAAASAARPRTQHCNGSRHICLNMLLLVRTMQSFALVPSTGCELAAQKKRCLRPAIHSQRTICAAMLRSMQALAHSVTAASGYVRMFSHVAARVGCSIVGNPQNFPQVRDPAKTVKYCCESNMVAEHVRSLLIFPESSFASDHAGQCCREPLLLWLDMYVLQAVRI